YVRVDGKLHPAVGGGEIGLVLLSPLMDGPQAVGDPGPPGQGRIEIVTSDPKRVGPRVDRRVVNAGKVARSEVQVLIDTRDVAEPVKFLRPSRQESQHRVPAGRVG